MRGLEAAESVDGIGEQEITPVPVWQPMPQRRLRCYKCGYEWDTKAKLKYVTCPSCHYKIDSAKSSVIRTT